MVEEASCMVDNCTVKAENGARNCTVAADTSSSIDYITH